MRPLVLVLPVALLLSGCGGGGPTVAFDPQAAAFVQKQGKGTITGQAFYRSEKGTVVYAAGEHVFLVPVTPYSEQRFAVLYGGGKYVQVKHFPKIESDPEYARFTRDVKAGPSGRFKFENVAPGDYFVATQVSWQEEDSFVPNGSAIYERVSLSGREDKPVDVIVSGR